MKELVLHIDQHITLEWLEPIIKGPVKVVIHQDLKMKVDQCRAYLNQVTKDSSKIIYGVNTGFGSLCQTVIPNDQLEQLQVNLLRSHACGMGREVPEEVVRLMLFLKILSLTKGHSGVQFEVIERLCLFLERNWLPVVYTQGSLGASGDLAPLAHLCLPLIGEGLLKVDGEYIEADTLLHSHGLAPLRLQSKEGLALINGTQFMTAYGMYILAASAHLLDWADALAAFSVESFQGRVDAYYPHSHQIRPHQGQLKSAALIYKFLEGRDIEAVSVQDPYSIRCAPQVHGASRGVWNHVKEVMETEINGVTDNPNIFPEDDMIISAGNFHGQPLAMALDYLSLAIHEIGSISERRVYLLISGQRGLPAFLTTNPGLNSGFMIPQYTAAGIVSQNKQFCMPSSSDSIPSSNGQEDHVSMGANAAVKSLDITENVYTLFGIELFTTSQALDILAKKPAPAIQNIYQSFRRHVLFIEDDTYMKPNMDKARSFVKNHHAIEFLKTQ